MNVTNVRVNLMLHGGNQVNLEKTHSAHTAAVGITFALKSLTSNERKSMSLMRDRMKSLEHKSKTIGHVMRAPISSNSTVIKDVF